MATSSLAWTRAAALLGLPRAAGWPATLDTLQAAALQAPERREAGLIAATLTDACKAGEVACEAGQRTVHGRRARGYIGPAPIGARVQPAPKARTVQAYRIGPHAFSPWLKSQGLTPGELVTAWARAVTPEPVARKAATEARQDERLRACEAAGLPMPATLPARMPDGIAKVADAMGATRQAFTDDIKAAIKRRAAASREGVTRHRIE